MIVESIYAVVDALDHRYRIKHVTNLVDNQGRKYTEVTQYFYTPYNNSGKIEIEHTKGTNIDHNA